MKVRLWLVAIRNIMIIAYFKNILSCVCIGLYFTGFAQQPDSSLKSFFSVSLFQFSQYFTGCKRLNCWLSFTSLLQILLFYVLSVCFAGAYVPEGLLTSCTWDYMTFTPSVRAYTMLLFTFVFFIPLIVIIYCYFFIFRSIRSTNEWVLWYRSNYTIRINYTKRQQCSNVVKMSFVLYIILLYIILGIIGIIRYDLVTLDNQW